MNSLDVNNRSCCVLRDVCECWQACSCTNIMCRAACIASVLHECFSECYNLSLEICSCLTLSLLDHDCLYQAGLLTICYASVWQEQSSCILCILVLLLIWVLQIVIACAASGRITIDYSLIFLQDKTYAGKVTIAFLTEWMPCLFSLEFSEGKPIRTSPLDNQTLDVYCLWHTI